MGNEINKKIWAIILIALMIGSTFVGIIGIVGGETTSGNYKTFSPANFSPMSVKRVDPSKIMDADLPTTRSPGPGPQPEMNYITESFEGYTLNADPPDPPWDDFAETPGAAETFGPYNFDTDTSGADPANPPWTVQDGASPAWVWGPKNADSETAGSPPNCNYYYQLPGSSVIVANDVSYSPSNSYFINEAGTSGGGSYNDQFGWTGLGWSNIAYYGAARWYTGPNTGTNYGEAMYWVSDTSATKWIVGRSATQWRAVNGNGAGGGTWTNLGAFTWNTWYLIEVQMNAALTQFQVRINGGAWSALLGHLQTGGTAINAVVCFGGAPAATGGTPHSINHWDDIGVWQPPSGGTQAINVVNAQYHSSPNSLSLDQNTQATMAIATCNLATTVGHWGTGTLDYWVRTSTPIANSNGASMITLDGANNAGVNLKIQGGQIQYYNRAGSNYLNAQAVVASTWYQITVNYDTTTGTYDLLINGVSRATGVLFASASSRSIMKFRYNGTASAAAEAWLDDLSCISTGANADIYVTNTWASAGTQSMRIDERGSPGGSPNTQAGIANYTNFGFSETWGWVNFTFNTANYGSGLTVQIYDITVGPIAILFGFGVDYTGGGNPDPGVMKWIDGDGTGSGMIHDGRTYAAGTHTIAVNYFVTNQTYFAYFDGTVDTATGMGFLETSTSVGAMIFFGDAPDQSCDIMIDSITHEGPAPNYQPTPPTNCYVTLPPPLGITYNNYTVTADNPQEGIVTGTYAAVDENPPAGDLESIQEASIGGGSGNYSLVNNESFESTTFPPTGWTSTSTGLARSTAQYHTGVASAGYTGAGGAGENGNFLSPSVNTADATFLFVDFWWRKTVTGGTDFFLDYYDNTGAWDQILDIGSVATNNAWVHFQSGRITDAQYIHAAFQIRFRMNGEAGDNFWLDDVYIYKEASAPASYSLAHRWTTQNVAAGADTMTLFVTANYNVGSNDNFDFGYSTVLGGPYTPLITVNSATLTTYSASMPILSGVLYINVIDSNSADATGQDTVNIDQIRIQWEAVTGTTSSTQQATADNAVFGTVTGTYAATNPPADAATQNIQERVVGTKSESEPTPMSPEPQPKPRVEILANQSFETWPATGWTTINGAGTRHWQQSNNGNPFTTPFGTYYAYVNYDSAYAQDEWLITPTLNFATYYNCHMFYHVQKGATWNEHFYIKVSTDGGGTWSAPLIDDYHVARAFADELYLDLSAYDFTANIRIAFQYYTDAPDAGDSLGLDWVSVHGDTPPYSLEHRWTMQNLPVNSISRTLTVRARFNTGSNDNFEFGWSQVLGGPYTPVITVNSDVLTYYNASIPTSFDGAFYVNVIDSNNGDTTGQDTVYVDLIQVTSVTSLTSNAATVRWTLSTDDGGGANDIVRYNIYRADEEDGDTIAGPYSYIGNSPAGTNTYQDTGEGLDTVNQAWYYVEAQDAGAPVKFAVSGNFSKLNFGPAVSNVMANGVLPKLTISPGLQTITITADAYDDSSQFEAIPQMNYAEMYVDAGPPTEIQPVDLIWDAMLEPLQGDITQAWIPGVYEVWVRAREIQNGTQVWGNPMNVTIEVIDGPPMANAGPDQSVPQHTLVNFDGSMSTDDVGITGYWWNFTDGTPQTLTGPTPSYTFNTEGVYVVTLEVRDTIGQSGIDTMNVTVTDGDPPVADAGIDQTNLRGFLTAFDGSGSYDPNHDIPPDRGIINWTWTFTDGGAQTLYGKTPTYTFNIAGTYTVTLTVTDAVTLTDTDTMDVIVQDYFNIDITQAAGATDGWILVSFPSKVAGDPLTILVDAVNDGAGYVQWDIVQRYESNPMAPQPGWLTTATFKPPVLNDFTNVDNNMGFWIHITNIGDGNLAVVGDLPITGEVFNIQLYTGWNLVGYPCMTTQDISTVIGGMLFNVIQTEVYDPTNADGYRTRWQDPWDSVYFLNPGQGIWIEVSADEIWTITCP
jgi:hypothetical protein